MSDKQSELTLTDSERATFLEFDQALRDVTMQRQGAFAFYLRQNGIENVARWSLNEDRTKAQKLEG